MRSFCVLLTAMFLVLPGCSAVIARSGKDLRTVTTSQEVHAQFGTPDTSEVVEGNRVDVFHTRQKIAEQKYDGEVWTMCVGMTFGLFEVVAGPYEACRVVQHSVFGRDLHVTYDAGGNVTKFELDGQRIDPNRAKGKDTPEIDPEAAKTAGVP